MSKNALIVTGGNGYILKNFNFKIFSKKYDLFFIHSRKKKDIGISYNENDLEFLTKKIISSKYQEIILISFGAHLGEPIQAYILNRLKILIVYLKVWLKQKKKFSYIMPHLLAYLIHLKIVHY